MNKKTMIASLVLSLLPTLSAYSQTAPIEMERVDLLILVEPRLVDEYGMEALHVEHKRQLDYANKQYAPFGVQFSIAGLVPLPDNSISEELEGGEYLGTAISSWVYSAGHTTETFTEELFPGMEYKPFTAQMIDKYHADKVVVSVHGQDTNGNTIGRAYLNVGFGQTYASTVGTSTFAHELGHTFFLGHPSKEECNTKHYLMCQGFAQGDGFTDEQVESLKFIIASDGEDLTEFPFDVYDTRFWVGDYSKPANIEAYAKLTVIDNVIETDSDATEIVVELVDDKGVPVTLDKDVAVELYTIGGTAVAGVHYNKDAYQTVTFAAGESTKRIDFDVSSGSTDATLSVGTKYGINIADSNTATITIKAEEKPKPEPEPEPQPESGSSGGSLGFIALISLALLRLFGRR